jgi:putative heme iron utilization protein
MTESGMDPDALAEEFREFLGSFDSLQLATASRGGEPEASYAPFYRGGGNFFIYISDLSRHAANLAENPRAAVMLLEDEAEAKNPFARRRATYQCLAEEVPRGSQEFELTMDAMQEAFGNFVGMVRKLGDFHLYRLEPIAGSYVAGFARAFRLVGEDLDRLERVDGKADAPATGTLAADRVQDEARPDAD